MTSPVIEPNRNNVPLNVEHERCIPMSVNEDDYDYSGFPFERDFDSRDGFRSQLDDIAQRHPEFAEHLGGFPFSRSGRGAAPRAEDPEFRSNSRFTDRPFGSRFDRFNIPFDSDQFNVEPEQYRQYYQAHPEYYPPETQPEPPTKTEEEAQKVTQPPPPAPQGGDRSRKVQQSNTVDLGQAQEAVNDRNQRSMSAPPPENRTGQRFVSSVKIPMGGVSREAGGGDMGSQQSHQPNKPMERVIPIHVEGRDEPVVPKNHQQQTFTQPQPQQPQQNFSSHPPQSERIFGQMPDQFTQFLRREPRQFASAPDWRQATSHGASPDDLLRQQQQQYQKEQEQRYQQQKEQAPPQQPPPTQQEAPKAQPQQQQKTLAAIDLIQAIQKDVSQLMNQVENFGGKPRDKQYLYLDEMLTRNLLKLDDIDTQGQDVIRSARREAVKCIEKCIGVLEAKAAANVAQNQPMEVPESATATAAESKESSGETKVAEPMEAVEASKPEESMEVVPDESVGGKVESEKPAEVVESVQAAEVAGEAVVPAEVKEGDAVAENSAAAGEAVADPNLVVAPVADASEDGKKEKKKGKKKAATEKK